MFSERIIEQYGDAYSRFGADERAHHENMLKQVVETGQVAARIRPLEDQRWEISVAATDHPGLLSLIAGLLTSHRISIRRGNIFTIADPTSRPRSRGLILDVFEVLRSHVEDEEYWEAFRLDLAGMVGRVVNRQYEQVRQELIERVSDTLTVARREYEPLYPVSIDFDNAGSPAYTLLKVASRETPGFLFSLSNALTMLHLDIHHARIMTVGDEVQDTFWIREVHGGKVKSAESLNRVRVAAALIKQFTYLLPHSSNPAQALRQFRDLLDLVLRDPARMADIDRLQSAETMQTLAELMGVSKFLWEDFLRMQYDSLFPIVSDESISRERAEDPAEVLDRLLADCENHDERVDALNRFKDQEIFRADLRHITGRSSDVEFTHEVSDLAALVVNRAAAMCYDLLESRYGKPRLKDGRNCQWAVFALGKCGGREMGFASDIELMFVYEGIGKTDGAKSTATQVFFEQVVHLFLKSVRARQKGVFEIDLRLRPYGKKGTLAVSLNAFKSYYSPEGAARQFERMALTRMRQIAGADKLGEQVIKARDAFVYSSQPLDYGDIMHLRNRQANELVAHNAVNAKYSPGGLVDLEYFVQARQIECGADNPRVRVPNTMEALSQLEAVGAIEPKRAERIRSAYAFMRRLIDALRAIRGNAKDLSIPGTDSRAFKYLARRLGFQEPSQLEHEIEDVMRFGRGLWPNKVS